MDEVVKNTHAFIDILCMARGEAVQGWDEDTFHKAFKWAQYFEQVHAKLRSKAGLADKLDRYLNNFNKTTSVYLGTLQMSFSRLAHSKSILRTSLLQNPYLSTEQFPNVLKLYGVNIGSQNDTKDVDILQQDVTDLMMQKGTLKMISQMRNKLTKDYEQTSARCCSEIEEKRIGLDTCTSDTIARQATGELLFKYAQHVMEISGKDGDCCLRDKLDVISTLDDGMQIITSCLLCLPYDCLSPGKAAMVQTHIVTSLLENIKRNPVCHPIWTLPVDFLSALAYKYQDILTMYLDSLTSWANTMMPVLSFQLSDQELSVLGHGQVYVWRSAKGLAKHEDTGTFGTLVNHFHHLLQGPLHVQELCSKTIKNNIRNYDNDLQFSSKEPSNQLGVDVWKDLFKTLNDNIL